MIRLKTRLLILIPVILLAILISGTGASLFAPKTIGVGFDNALAPMRIDDAPLYRVSYRMPAADSAGAKSALRLPALDGSEGAVVFSLLCLIIGMAGLARGETDRHGLPG